MSDDRQSRRNTDVSRRSAEGATAELDRVIDQVAREMTEGALSGDFRARVVARMTRSDERRETKVRSSSFGVRRWLFSPIAAAAIVLVALLVARGIPGGRKNVEIPRPPSTERPPAIDAQLPRAEVPSARDVVARSSVTPARASRRAAADWGLAALAPVPLTTTSIDIDRLKTESIAIPDLETIQPIAVAPLATPEGERQ